MTIFSDHNPLVYLRECAPKSAKLTRWALGLQEFMHADSSIFHTSVYCIFKTMTPASLCVTTQRRISFLPLDAMLLRAISAVVACPSVCPSVRPSQAGVLSKRLDESSWVLVRRLPSTSPTPHESGPFSTNRLIASSRQLCYFDLWWICCTACSTAGVISTDGVIISFISGTWPIYT